MVGSFGKENMDKLEEAVGQTVIVKFVLYGQMAVIEGRLCKASKFSYILLKDVESFVAAGGKGEPAKEWATIKMAKVTQEIIAAEKIGVPFIGNNSAIRKISLVRMEEKDVGEKETEEEKIKREKKIALLVSKIENRKNLNDSDKALLESIAERRRSFLLVPEEETLYFNPFIPVYFIPLKSVGQVQRFKEVLWGEEAEKNEINNEGVDKFKKFWHK